MTIVTRQQPLLWRLHLGQQSRPSLLTQVGKVYLKISFGPWGQTHAGAPPLEPPLLFLMKHVLYTLNPFQVKSYSHSSKTIKVRELITRIISYAIFQFLLNFKLLFNLCNIYRACARDRAEVVFFDEHRVLPERPRSSSRHSKRNDICCTPKDIRSETTSDDTAGATCCRNNTTCGWNGKIYHSSAHAWRFSEPLNEFN